MKKITFTFVLLLVLSIVSFGDEGDLPGGGKPCSNGQPTCRAESPENPIIKTFKEFVISLFI